MTCEPLSTNPISVGLDFLNIGGDPFVLAKTLELIKTHASALLCLSNVVIGSSGQKADFSDNLVSLLLVHILLLLNTLEW